MGVFFFKQKTADEVRISDWSSDVCSSDLEDEAESDTEMVQGVGDRFRTQDAGEEGDRPQRQNQREPRRARRNHEETEAAEQAQVPEEIAEQSQAHDTDERSEEHTSELQSLMRISYAVFCLKKKNRKK